MQPLIAPAARLLATAGAEGHGGTLTVRAPDEARPAQGGRLEARRPPAMSRSRCIGAHRRDRPPDGAERARARRAPPGHRPRARRSATRSRCATRSPSSRRTIATAARKKDGKSALPGHDDRAAQHRARAAVARCGDRGRLAGRAARRRGAVSSRPSRRGRRRGRPASSRGDSSGAAFRRGSVLAAGRAARASPGVHAARPHARRARRRGGMGQAPCSARPRTTAGARACTSGARRRRAGGTRGARRTTATGPTTSSPRSPRPRRSCGSSAPARTCCSGSSAASTGSSASRASRATPGSTCSSRAPNSPTSSGACCPARPTPRAPRGHAARGHRAGRPRLGRRRRARGAVDRARAAPGRGGVRAAARRARAQGPSVARRRHPWRWENPLAAMDAAREARRREGPLRVGVFQERRDGEDAWTALVPARHAASVSGTGDARLTRPDDRSPARAAQARPAADQELFQLPLGTELARVPVESAPTWRQIHGHVPLIVEPRWVSERASVYFCYHPTHRDQWFIAHDRTDIPVLAQALVRPSLGRLDDDDEIEQLLSSGKDRLLSIAFSAEPRSLLDLLPSHKQGQSRARVRAPAPDRVLAAARRRRNPARVRRAAPARRAALAVPRAARAISRRRAPAVGDGRRRAGLGQDDADPAVDRRPARRGRLRDPQATSTSASTCGGCRASA